MIDNISDEQSLLNAGIHLTAVRLLIWHNIRHIADTFTLSTLEEMLPTVDRSTLYRTLVLLAEAHLLHEIDDGSGTQKYCVCHIGNTQACAGHVHLTCQICHRTYCLPNVRIPEVSIPVNFHPRQIEYIIKGICSDCQSSTTDKNNKK